MASINGIKLKNIKKFTGHDGEPLHQGNIYVNGAKIGTWSMNYSGGICDDIYLTPPYKEEKLRDKIEEKNRHKAKKLICENTGKETIIPYSAEELFVDLISLNEDEKAFKKAVKAGFPTMVTVTDGYHMIEWRIPPHQANMRDEPLKEMLNIEETVKKEHFFDNYEVKVYRSLADFDIGIPITVSQLQG